MKPQDVNLLIGARWPARDQIAATERLHAAGLDDRVLTAGVRLGTIVRLRRGAYVKANDWFGAKPWEQDKLRVQAHFVSTSSKAVYSHVSAARLHDCWVWDGGAAVHLTLPFATGRPNHGSDVAPHHLVLGPAEVVQLKTKDGRPIRVTSLSRTVLDCARVLELPKAVIIGDHALRKGLTIEGLAAMLAADPVKRGSRRAQRVLESLDRRSESAGETRTRLLLRGLNIPQPELQLPIPTVRGVFRADFAWRERKLILEFDGKYKYFDFRPTEEVIFEERRREKALMELGWRFIRIEWADLARPFELEMRVQSALKPSGRLSVA